MRREDVLPLAMHILGARCRPGSRIPALSADAAHRLLTYSWPGNVRELDNLLQRALILVNGPVIEPEHIQFELSDDSALAAAATVAPASAPPKHGGLADSLEQAERELILDALQSGNATRREIAERLGISPRTLRHKLARLRAAGVNLTAREAP